MKKLMKSTLSNTKEELPSKTEPELLTEEEVKDLLSELKEAGRIGEEYLKGLKSGKR